MFPCGNKFLVVRAVSLNLDLENDYRQLFCLLEDHLQIRCCTPDIHVCNRMRLFYFYLNLKINDRGNRFTELLYFYKTTDYTDWSTVGIIKQCKIISVGNFKFI